MNLRVSWDTSVDGRVVPRVGTATGTQGKPQMATGLTQHWPCRQEEGSTWWLITHHKHCWEGGGRGTQRRRGSLEEKADSNLKRFN